MTNYYTNIHQGYNKICVRGIEDKKPFFKEIDFKPSLGVLSSKSSEGSWKTLDGKDVDFITFGSIQEANSFIAKYKDVGGFPIFGNYNFVQQYISYNFPGEIKYNFEDIKTMSIDIETRVEYIDLPDNTPLKVKKGNSIFYITPKDLLSKKGSYDEVFNELDGIFGKLEDMPFYVREFPDPTLAREEITVISLVNFKTGGIKTFSLLPSNNAEVLIFEDEASLLREFISYWANNYPNIITSWNGKLFDIPYLINRIRHILGDPWAKRLSPFGKVRERIKEIFNKKEQTYIIEGISELDYIDVYKKFGTYSTKESYALDFIANDELGVSKLKNPGKDFVDFYDNYPEVFVDYNRQDAKLILLLDQKMQLLKLVTTIAYYCKVNYSDVFSPVKTWDSLVCNYLHERRIAIPNPERIYKKEQTVGAFVKESIPGLHRHIATFDLASLYPSIVMQYNLSPETIMEDKLELTVQDLLDRKIDTAGISGCLSASGYMFSKESRGFLPELMSNMFAERKNYKKLYLDASIKAEKNPSKENLDEKNSLYNIQQGLKILLNSGSGSISNDYFRFFDPRIANSITLTGQITIKWVSNSINEFLNSSLKTDGKDYILANDTDSAFVCLDGVVKNLPNLSDEEKYLFIEKFSQKVMSKVITSSFNALGNYLNIFEQKMSMELDTISDIGLFSGKKRYILRTWSSEGVRYKEPKLKIVGLEIIKSSTPKIVREKLKTIIPIVLDGNEKNVQENISLFEEEFLSLNSEDIAFPRVVNGMEIYKGDPIYTKGTPIHVRGALLHNHLLKKLKLGKIYKPITNGSKIKFLYLKMPNPIHENVISFTETLPPEFGLNAYIDYQEQFNKTYISAVENIITPIGWKAKQQSSLEEFFF